MPDDSGSGLSRRQVLAVSGTGLLAATATGPARAAGRGRPGPGDGTPEQIHLTWGEDPARSVVVSWASPGQAVRPRVRIGQRVIKAEERVYTDGLNGQVTWTYHARVLGLRPGATYGYAVTADNDGNAADPFSATFTTAPEGRAEFRFTSFGDLATPNTDWVLSYGQAAYAVGAVESFQPLFHLLNGDLCYAGLNPAAQPEVWRDFGNNNQASAAYRPWMPVPGNHEIEFCNGPQGFTSYLTRYTLPYNGIPGFEGRWYSFRVGSVLFVSLSADDVVYQDAGAFVAGPAALTPAASTGNPPVPAGTSLYVRGYSGGAQTRWLEATLAAGAPGRLDRLDHRADAPVRLLLLARRQRLGPGHPGRVAAAVRPVRGGPGALRARPRLRALVPGPRVRHRRRHRGGDRRAGRHPAAAPGDQGGQRGLRHQPGHRAPDPGLRRDRREPDSYGAAAAGRREVFTRPNRPAPAATAGVYARAGADALEDATWSARRDTATGYGIAVFDVHPGGEAGGQTSITVTHYHAVGADPVNPATGEHGAPTDDYTVFETFTLVRPRSDGRRWHAKQSSSVTVAAGEPQPPVPENGF